MAPIYPSKKSNLITPSTISLSRSEFRTGFNAQAMSSGVMKKSPMPNTNETPNVEAITHPGIPSSVSGSRSMAAMLAES